MGVAPRGPVGIPPDPHPGAVIPFPEEPAQTGGFTAPIALGCFAGWLLVFAGSPILLLFGWSLMLILGCLAIFSIPMLFPAIALGMELYEPSFEFWAPLLLRSKDPVLREKAEQILEVRKTAKGRDRRIEQLEYDTGIVERPKHYQMYATGPNGVQGPDGTTPPRYAQCEACDGYGYLNNDSICRPCADMIGDQWEEYVGNRGFELGPVRS